MPPCNYQKSLTFGDRCQDYRVTASVNFCEEPPKRSGQEINADTLGKGCEKWIKKRTNRKMCKEIERNEKARFSIEKAKSNHGEPQKVYLQTFEVFRNRQRAI